MIRATLRTDLVTAAVAALLALFPAAYPTSAVAAEDPADSLSDDDKKCLGCHSTEGLSKSLANGETLSLHVRGAEFAKSVHRAIGCAGCHGDIDLKSHPGAARDIKSARQHSIERTRVCRQCHEDAFKQHEGSVHALRLSQGNTVAPVCTGCHGTHTVSPKTAYETCVKCHAAALGAHQKWLPNAALHHEVVSCAACHAPKALRMVDLRLYDGVTKGWALEKADSPQFDKLARSIDTKGDGLDVTELRNLLREINPNGTAVPKTLRGRIELRTNVEAHRLAAKDQAIRACDSCHRAGAEPFQNVTVSITGADGRPIRYRAQTEVLSAARAVESLPEFYAIGGTRSVLLDALFALALLSGVGVPLGHMTVRWLSRKYLKKSGEHDAPVKPPDQPR